jgi:hypothetical protein
MSLKLLDYNFNAVHVRSRMNPVADFISRFTAPPQCKMENGPTVKGFIGNFRGTANKTSTTKGLRHDGSKGGAKSASRSHDKQLGNNNHGPC